MDIIGSIFGSKEIISGTISGIDKMILTDEEKSDYKIKFLKHFEPYKLAQRVLAFAMAINFFLAFWVGVVLLLLESPLLPKYLELVALFELGYLMMLVMVWYFTAGTGIFKKKE